MNRTGLLTALAVGIVVGVVFGVHSQFDIDLAGLFFDPQTHSFRVHGQPWEQRTREAARWLIALISLPAFAAIAGKVIVPRWRMLMGGRAALFVVLTLGLGPGLVANTLFKDHWSRSRPTDVMAFGGADPFTAWWDPRGPCPNNCSFIAGEPSGGFWTLAPAALAPPQWRAAAYAGALTFGAALGLLRMAGGGHFFSDVVFAGVFMYLTVWSIYWLLFWRLAASAEPDHVERALGRIGEACRRAVAAVTQRIGRRDDKPF